jgi:hypothetical protein
VTDLTTNKTTSLPRGLFAAAGRVIVVNVPAGLLPSTGLPPSLYRFNYWSENPDPSLKQQIASFAPEFNDAQVGVIASAVGGARSCGAGMAVGDQPPCPLPHRFGGSGSTPRTRIDPRRDPLPAPLRARLSGQDRLHSRPGLAESRSSGRRPAR